MAAILKFKMAASTERANVIVTGLVGFIDHENMRLGTEIKPLRVSATEIWLKQIGMAAILKFQMAVSTERANVIVTGLIGFLDPENMGVGTKIKCL